MGITVKAIRSGVYLDTLNKKQVIADCMLQLAFGYLRKYGAGDEKFLPQCINTANSYTCKKPILTSLFLLSNYYAIELDNLLKQHGVKDFKNLDNIEGARDVYNKYLEIEKVITDLGYQDMPPALYEQLMSEMDTKTLKQKELNVNTKQKKSLFIKTN